MTKKTRKSFSQKTKDQAVDDYLSGKKSAQQVAEEIGCDSQLIYRWKTLREERAKGTRIDEFMEQGYDKITAQKLLEKDLEIEAYQKKVAEQAIMLDLLKKTLRPEAFQSESELTGLIKTTKKLDRKKRRVK